MISQLTVFLANEKGRLAAVTRTLADADVNMYALFLADTEDFGVARIFCDRPDATADLLREAGYRASVTPVLGVKVPNRPGGLASLLEFLDKSDVNIEYGYCFSVNADVAVDVLKVSNPSVEADLEGAGFTLVAPEEIYEIDR